MTSLHLALSAAETLGRLLELPRTVRSLAARVDRLIRYVEDQMIELAEAKEGQRVAEEAMDQRDRQWQLVLDSRVNAAEQKLSEATFRAEMAEAALATSEAEAASATERAKKYEAEVALACVEVERLITQRQEYRLRAEKAEAAHTALRERVREVADDVLGLQASVEDPLALCFHIAVAYHDKRIKLAAAEAEVALASKEVDGERQSNLAQDIWNAEHPHLARR